jgi:short-chain fatty acids transporter
VQRLALAFTGFAERFIPDAFVFALLATAIVFVAGLFVGAAPIDLIDAWGGGFWELLTFTLQMALVIITGYVVASAGPVRRLLLYVAERARSPKNAVALVALFAMATSWFNWGFSLIFSAVLAREIARRHRGIDYRALCAASLLGLGSIWAQGLSGSAALQMATPGAMPQRVRDIISNGMIEGGIVDFRHTIFLWQSLASVVIEIFVVVLIMWLAAPSENARDAQSLAIVLPDFSDEEIPPAKTLGERLEHSRILMLALCALGFVYVVHSWKGLAGLTLNSINLILLLVGFVLHGTPARLMRAVRDATPATWGVILQFPFYAGIAGMIAATKLNERIAGIFVSLSTQKTFPALMALYSTCLGVFVPSGGGKWLIEAPYVMKAAHQLHVHIGWVVASYDLGEAVANLVQPFWMLPVLALCGLRARDVMGYTFLVFIVLLPLVLILTTLLGATLNYPL